MDYSAAIGWRYDTMEDLEASKAWYIENGYTAEYFDDELRLSIVSDKEHDKAKTEALLKELLSKHPQHAEILRSIATPGLVGVE